MCFCRQPLASSLSFATCSAGAHGWYKKTSPPSYGQGKAEKQLELSTNTAPMTLKGGCLIDCNCSIIILYVQAVALSKKSQLFQKSKYSVVCTSSCEHAYPECVHPSFWREIGVLSVLRGDESVGPS